MPEVTALLKSAKTAKDFFNLLETGTLASLFLGIEFQAAREAFHRITSAVDKKGQTQICIGHLNSSYHACDYVLRRAGFLDRLLFSRSIRIDHFRQKARFLACVRAICHAFIGESGHCANDLLLAESHHDQDNPLGMAWVVSGGLINPVAAADLVYALIRGDDATVYDVDDQTIAQLRTTLLGPDASPAS